MNQTTPRRRALIRLAALGAVGPAGIAGFLSDALAKGDLPTLPGIHDATGAVSVNGKSAMRGTPVKPGDKVSTGEKSQAVVVMGKDAFLLRAGSNVVFEAEEKRTGALAGVAVLTGKVLSVFARRAEGEAGVRVKPPNATIGIRGTGAYVEIHEGRSYLCLCYGQAAVDGKGVSDPTVIKTTHHENPVWLDDRSGQLRVEKAPMFQHTDDELILLEKLVGREPPFVAMGLTGRY